MGVRLVYLYCVPRITYLCATAIDTHNHNPHCHRNLHEQTILSIARHHIHVPIQPVIQTTPI